MTDRAPDDEIQIPWTVCEVCGDSIQSNFPICDRCEIDDDDPGEYYCSYCGESIGFSPFNSCVCDYDFEG